MDTTHSNVLCDCLFNPCERHFVQIRSVEDLKHMLRIHFVIVFCVPLFYLFSIKIQALLCFLPISRLFYIFKNLSRARLLRYRKPKSLRCVLVRPPCGVRFSTVLLLVGQSVYAILKYYSNISLVEYFNHGNSCDCVSRYHNFTSC